MPAQSNTPPAKGYAADNGRVKIRGVIESVRHLKTDTSWAIIDIIMDQQTLVTVKGVVEEPKVGDAVQCEGVWDTHSSNPTIKVYGLIEKREPQDTYEIKKFLSALQGVGAASATKITDVYGPDTYKVLKDNKDNPKGMQDVLKSTGLSKGQVDNFIKGWDGVVDRLELSAEMTKLGLTPEMQRRAREIFEVDLLDVIENSPYDLVAVPGVTFKRLDDKLISSGNVKPDSVERLTALCNYTVDLDMQKQGHTWLSEADFKAALGVTHSGVGAQILARWGEIIPKAQENDRLAKIILKTGEVGYTSTTLDHEEQLIATSLQSIANRSFRPIYITEDPQLNAEQNQAVIGINSGVSIITGGPGTGKTHTLKTALKHIQENGERIVCYAPTGKAAKRMTESTGMPAQTIHQLLSTAKIDDLPEKGLTVVVDETSMMSTSLFAKLLEKLGPERIKRLILVGDDDQIPSIDPGRVLHDLIQTKKFWTVNLTKIMRQAPNSFIAVNAAKIRTGDTTLEGNKPGGDFFLSYTNEDDAIPRLLTRAYKESIPNLKDKDGHPYDLLRDVQVLTPKNAGVAGVLALNNNLQAILNPEPKRTFISERKVSVGGQLKDLKINFKEGDKVLITKNQHDKGVVNGDVGFISEVKPGSMRIAFDDGRTLDVNNKEEALHVSLGYAITVHKSQGSEMPFAIVVMGKDNNPTSPLRERSILYTAVTRGKERVWIVGDKPTIDAAITTARTHDRRTCLKERVSEYYQSKSKQRAPEPIDLV